MSKTKRVFVTGATGWIGTALVKELREAGHAVLGAARDDAGAEKLKAQGVDVHRADLREPRSLEAGVRETDATIHLAFHMDFSDWEGINRLDRAAIEVMLGAMEGTGKAFVGTTGTLLVSRPGEIAAETDGPAERSSLHIRYDAERLVIGAKDRGIRSSVVRLAPTVHGAGDKGFMTMLTRIARDRGFAAYLGEGSNHWPAVHRDDAARLYRLAMELAPAGTVLHGSAEEGVTMRAIAETIAAGTGVPTRRISEAEAPDHFGFLSMVVGLDNRASSRATRELLGWKPERPGLLDDLRASYF